MAKRLVCDVCEEGAPPRQRVIHYTITSEDRTHELDLCEIHDARLLELLNPAPEVLLVEGREYPLAPEGADSAAPVTPRKRRGRRS